MGVRAVFAAAVFAVGVGQAEAAIFHYGVEFVETSYSDVMIDTETDSFAFTSLSSLEDQWGLPLLWDGLKYGTTYGFYMVSDASGVVSCTLGKYDCSIWNDPYWSYYTEDPLNFSDEYNGVRFDGHEVGSVLTVFQNWMGMSMNFAGDGFSGHTGDRHTQFRIVDLAPVPLPAPAALLPLGLGTLAVMRKRRRS